MKLSKYFIAKLAKNRTWFVSGCVRNLGHAALERALDPEKNIFEFFVAPNFASEFVALLAKLQQRGEVITFFEHPNRFGS